MAVIISNGATNLSTVNGFYRVESSNLSGFSATVLALSSARTIAVTFANAGNCQGVILALCQASSTAILLSAFKSVTVALEELVLGVWTSRATVTLSAATISNSSTSYAYGSSWVVPFTGGTFPYAVNTTAGIWRFNISNATGTNDWSLCTSDATNPFYVTWCDTAVTFANNDTIICKDVVTIDQTATIRGTLGTGDAANGVAAVICRSTTPTPANVANLLWSNPPAASYTFTVNGVILMCAHAGFRIGTSAARIPFANKAIVDFIAPTVGTITNIKSIQVSNLNNYKQSLFLYGAIPAVAIARLNADAAAAQKNIVTTTSTGWTVGDRLVVGKQDVAGLGVYDVANTINTIAGANIGMTNNLLTNIRKSGGPVINLEGYGIRFLGYGSILPLHNITSPNNFVISGVELRSMKFTMSLSANQWLDDTGNQSQYSIDNSVWYHTASVTLICPFSTFSVPSSGFVMDKFYTIGGTPVANTPNAGFTFSISGWNGFGQASGTVRVTNGVWQQGSNAGFGISGVGTTFSNNELYNFFGNTVQPFVTYGNASPGLVDATVTNNIYYGITALVMSLQNFIPTTWSGDKFNKNTTCIAPLGFVSAILTDGVFGNEQANTTEYNFIQDTLNYLEFASPTGSMTISATNQKLPITGTIVKISDYNDVANDDRDYLKYGFYVRTGTSLSDTTVHTPPGFAIRMQPNDGTNVLNWPNLVSERSIPTGNIQNLTMTVSCWVNINAAAYYAGTYQLPRLNIKYDNASLTYTQAAQSTGWQLLFVSFVPLTAYGQIEVWMTGATDATGSNAYFYVDDFSVQYPAGTTLDIGSLDLWAHAVPVWPPIATLPGVGQVWDELTSLHSATGSFGELATMTGIKVDDNQALILAK